MTEPSMNMSELYPNEREAVTELMHVWRSKISRNRLRQDYYDMHTRLKDMGIAIPPPLKNFETVVGWPQKAVDQMAKRSRFDGWAYDGNDDLGIEQISLENNLNRSYRGACQAELTHSCSFMTVSKGEGNEPEAIISTYTSLDGSAVWDARMKRIKYGMVVHDIDQKTKKPTWIYVYFPDYVLEMLEVDYRWMVDRKKCGLGRPLMEPFAFSATPQRPFGKSRISRAVMSITDSAIRESLRSEVASEFAAAPQKYLLGADDDVFADKSKWDAYIGSIFSVGKDSDGDLPQYGQLPQPSMSGHTEYMRDLAARFSGETDIPVSSLGIIHDNPASAEAINAAADDLIADVEVLNEDNGDALKNVGLMALAVANGTTIEKLPESYRNMMVKWRDPARISMAAQSDAMMKIVQTFPWMADSEIALSRVGFSDAEVKILMSEKRKGEAKSALETLSAAMGAQNGNTGTV